ncbi:MAG TPA: pyridoxal phosphate-dependent aminotransferase [Terriglobales bacterium]|nr:pyridoxal phosphate-dependent aminotransferase [Terriglobales bacterium]
MFAARTAWSLAPNRFSAALEEARRSGRELLDLTESNPTRVGLRYPAGTLESLSAPRGLEYRPEALGLQEAREAVSAYYRELGWEVTPDSVVLTSGTSEAYSFLFRLLCDPGDEVLVAAPSYPLLDFLADIQDVKLVPYPLLYDHGWQIDLHTLEQRLSSRSRAVLLVHPNNPTGSYVRSAEREALNQICAARGMALIADEVFLDFALADKPPFTFAANQGVLTCTLSGLSKIAALPQVKLGWMVVSGPESQRREALERLEVIADTYLSVGTPVQLATAGLLRNRAQVQQQLRERVRTNLAELDRQLAARPTCRRLEVEAGWYAVLRVPAVRSDEDLAIMLLRQHGVVVHPGHFYDFATDGHLVISLIPPPDRFTDGLRRLFTAL